MAVQTSPPPQTPHTGTAQVGPFAFDTGPYTLQCLPIELLPYYDSSVVRNCVLADDSGVAMFRSGEAVYNHPVAQALCALKVSNYRLTRGQRYLDFAIANAQRLLDRAVMHRSALFISYPFDYLNSARAHMAAPWYSAMAQGQARSVFIRLFELTGDTKWEKAAHQTFLSFKVNRESGKPWVVGVENRLLWLDEYPTIHSTKSSTATR